MGTTTKLYGRKVFTIVAIFAPILSLYAVNIATLSFFDVILLLLFAFYFIVDRKIKINRDLLNYSLVIIALLFFALLFLDVDAFDVTFRTLRYVFYLLVIALFSSRHFDVAFGEKVYRFLSVFGSLFLWLQLIVLKIWKVYIPGFFTKLPLIRIEMLWHATNYQDRFTLGPRPRSIFSEPQIFATFVSGYIVILLFKEKKSRMDKIILVFLNISVVASLSSTGIVSLAVVWIYYFYVQFKKGRYNKVLFVCFIGLAAVVAVLPTLYESKLIFASHSINERLSWYEVIFNNKENVISFIFGHGMVDIQANDIAFLPSLLRVYYYYGVIGIVVLTILFINFYKNCKEEYKGLVVLSAVLLLGTVDFFGIMIFVSLPFIISEYNNVSTEDFVYGLTHTKKKSRFYCVYK